ncbi:hypothetical protein EV137_5352 [Kribbella pratensis]|uniref:Uncharacterized protein n=1 Tax=Kribbella pratensis TaxID=2512112 RepID=A0ABY2F9U0_9ACTN|nr:hypothetical protein [Kribbella pratensis]TDW87279.1 hypothetical protein EV137_5352 [Kribbella pratensis]
MSAGKVTVTRGELESVRVLIAQAIRQLDVLIARRETQPVETDDKGWPLLGEGSGVIELPDEENPNG